MKILIIEDDKNILSFLIRGFEEDGFIVDKAIDGKDGEYLALINNYDVIILDWMLPNKSGIDVLKSLRNNNILTPIIMLTAKNEIPDKIEGLRSGCDDYLSKPFSFDELEARVEALYRRVLSSCNKNILEFKNIKIDLEKKDVYQNSEVLSLSAREYELLIFLIKHKNSFISKAMIENGLYNCEEYIKSNVIEVTIYNLRKKIGKEFIKSFRGLGYKIEV